MTTDRYMTPAGKDAEMAHWSEMQRIGMRPDNDPGGHGYVDPEVLGLCDAINEMDYVCTLQSCAGHRLERHDEPGSFYVENAGMWLWLRKDKARQLYSRILELEGSHWVESLQVQWIDGREIVDIKFRPWGLTREACLGLLSFLRGLTPRTSRTHADPMRGVF